MERKKTEKPAEFYLCCRKMAFLTMRKVYELAYMYAHEYAHHLRSHLAMTQGTCQGLGA